jgi:hypothetical protein
MRMGAKWLRRLAAAVIASTGLAAVPAAGQQLYWYDGDLRRPLWADATLQAEFSGPAAEKSRVLRPAGLSKDGATSAVSPVFRDRAGGQGQPRALPGGVIVRLREGTTDAQRQALFAKHGLQPVREQSGGTGAWLVAAAAGLPSLELANRLHESGDFAGASPNWWQPRTRK